MRDMRQIEVIGGEDMEGVLGAAMALAMAQAGFGVLEGILGRMMPLGVELADTGLLAELAPLFFVGGKGPPVFEETGEIVAEGQPIMSVEVFRAEE